MSNVDAVNEMSGGAGCNRRDFLGLVGVALGALALEPGSSQAAEVLAYRPPLKTGAKVRVAFIYPPTPTFTNDHSRSSAMPTSGITGAASGTSTSSS